MTGSNRRPPGWRPAFRIPFGARPVEGDVDEEIAFHLAMREERLRARGLAPDDARETARRRFGDLEQVRREMMEIDREQARRVRATDTLEDMMQDVVFALRGLRRAPGFALAAILTLALGIGSAAAIFSVTYGVLLRPLPYPAAEQLTQLNMNLAGTGTVYGSFSAPEYVDLERDNRSFSVVATWAPRDRTFGGEGNPERVPAAMATASIFRVLGVSPQIGRYYTREEEANDGARVVVLSDAFWRRHFAGDRRVLGTKVVVDAVPREIIGVLPPGAHVGSAEAYTPMGFSTGQVPGRGRHFLSVVARRKPGVTLQQAQDEMAQFARRTLQEHPTNYGTGGITASARDLRTAMYGEARPLMLALLGTVVLLLLLASVNVANLLLVRAEARQRELGVRVALGAGRGRIIRQLLTESMLLAMIGALIGIPLAAVGVKALLAINPGVVPPGGEVAMDAGVLAAVIGVVALAALVAGVAPALRAGSTDVRTAIAAGSAGGGRAGGRLRSALVALEVALAAAMLVGAGLVGRSFQKLLSVDPGFQAGNVLTMDVALPRVKYDTATKVLAFYDQALERMRALPGVRAAAATASLPLGGNLGQWSVALEGNPESVRTMDAPFFVSSTPDVFKALGITILRGRGFTDADNAESVPVAVVSETMARKFWPGEDAVGKRFEFSGEKGMLTVVGVARDVRPEALSAPPYPTYYVVSSQFAKLLGFTDAAMTIVLRTSGDPAALTNAARSIVHDLDRDLALDNVQTLEQVVTGSVARPRFAAAVLGAFGLSALVLAVVGVYGVLSYAMTRRRRELAVRMALGARPREVSWLVIGSGLRLAGAGVAVGLVVAAVGGRVLTALLYDVSPTDPATIAAVGAALLVAAAVASWLPARRATTVSPAEVLRGE